MTKSPRFIDPEVQSSYDDLGFVHIKGVLDKDDLAELNQLFSRYYNYSQGDNFLWNSLFSIGSAQGRELSELILKIVYPKLKLHMADFISPSATFLVKNPTPNSTIDLHRDFSILEEENFSYKNIWMPIVDITPDNGQLIVMRRIHKLFDYPLPHMLNWPHRQHDPILLKYCDKVTAKAGDLVVYGDRVPHGSLNNITNQPRPVVHFGLVHPDARVCYYYLDPATQETTVYEVPYTFFFENNWGNQDHRFPIIKKFKYNPPQYTTAQIQEWVDKNIIAVDKSMVV